MKWWLFLLSWITWHWLLKSFLPWWHGRLGLYRSGLILDCMDGSYIGLSPQRVFRQVLAMQVLQLSGWWHITVVGGDKALAVPQPEEKTIGAIVVERLLPRSHQLLRGTHRRLKDWIIPSKWVKLHGSKSVLCQIRAMLALSLLFASGKKKKRQLFLSPIVDNWEPKSRPV